MKFRVEYSRGSSRSLRIDECLLTDTKIFLIDRQFVSLIAHETILLPEEYFNEFRKEGEVLNYPTDWSTFDLKSFAQGTLKAKQAFLISEQRRFRISRNAFEISTEFAGGLQEFSILRRGKNFSSFAPGNLKLEPTNRLKEAKKKDVKRLLTIIGIDERHPAYSFYANSCSLGPGENPQNSSYQHGPTSGDSN